MVAKLDILHQSRGNNSGYPFFKHTDLFGTTHNGLYLFVVEFRHQTKTEYYRHYFVEISFISLYLDYKLIVADAHTIRSTVFRKFSAEVVVRLIWHSTGIVHQTSCVLEFLVGMRTYLILESKREDIVLRVFHVEHFTAIEEVFALDIGEIGEFRRRSLYGSLHEVFVILRIFFVGHLQRIDLCLIEKLYFGVSFGERDSHIVAREILICSSFYIFYCDSFNLFFHIEILTHRDTIEVRLCGKMYFSFRIFGYGFKALQVAFFYRLHKPSRYLSAF